MAGLPAGFRFDNGRTNACFIGGTQRACGRCQQQVSSGTMGGVQVGVLVREVWRGLSARALLAGEAPAADKGLTRKIDGLTLSRSACTA